MTAALELIRGLKVADLGAHESRVVRIFTVRDGKIVRVQSFFDTAEYAKALHD